jgi:hypothetical protein
LTIHYELIECSNELFRRYDSASGEKACQRRLVLTEIRIDDIEVVILQKTGFSGGSTKIHFSLILNSKYLQQLFMGTETSIQCNFSHEGSSLKLLQNRFHGLLGCQNSIVY